MVCLRSEVEFRPRPVQLQHAPKLLQKKRRKNRFYLFRKQFWGIWETGDEPGAGCGVWLYRFPFAVT